MSGLMSSYSNRPFKLSEITAMKLKCVKQLNDEIKVGITKGHLSHVAACQAELASVKMDAMHPDRVYEKGIF